MSPGTKQRLVNETYHAIGCPISDSHLLFELAKIPVTEYSVIEYAVFENHDVIDTNVPMKNTSHVPRIAVS